MAACIIDDTPRATIVPKPRRRAGEVLIRVTLAGICNTDLEIVRGYVPGFNGIPGHEFVGVVEEADDSRLVGKRVTAEINCACGQCEYCRAGLGRHCPTRTVIGIINRDGCFAEYMAVPQENVVEIPDTISAPQAVLIEPTAAALEILDQVTIGKTMNVLLLGYGKLGMLIAHTLITTGCTLTIVGKHPRKSRSCGNIPAHYVPADDFVDGQFDVVVEATGNPAVLERAIANTKPRGTLVLKSTYAGNPPVNLSPIVVNEITLVGSRCGRFEAALAFMQNHYTPVEPLIHKTFPLTDAVQAFTEAAKPGALKVLLKNE
ncbi:MAG: alcohol dehydrogenase catalytic domain-containing protein [Chitinivibrionales bacterium]|nr:alcohol dehydrogenase catalytic domain-containing protein [Chitinivibrionales bacterium]MBD3355722.1 alcohol dehydrogenase catalytic domain-containing protein [Chitinivibrionales bacterium]